MIYSIPWVFCVTNYFYYNIWIERTYSVTVRKFVFSLLKKMRKNAKKVNVYMMKIYQPLLKDDK